MSQLRRELERQQTSTSDLQDLVKEQQALVKDLQSQISDQTSETERLVERMREQQRLIDSITDVQARSASSMNAFEESSNSQTGILWAVGGMILVLAVGGSIVLVCVIVLLAQPQRQQHRTATTHLIHPAHMPPPYSYAEQELLPAQVSRPRRANYIDYSN